MKLPRRKYCLMKCNSWDICMQVNYMINITIIYLYCSKRGRIHTKRCMSANHWHIASPHTVNHIDQYAAWLHSNQCIHAVYAIISLSIQSHASFHDSKYCFVETESSFHIWNWNSQHIMQSDLLVNWLNILFLNCHYSGRMMPQW